jgi:hypothetical protein
MIINGTWILLGAAAWGIYKLACWVHALTDSGRKRLGPLVGSAHASAPAGSSATDRENGSPS